MLFGSLIILSPFVLDILTDFFLLSVTINSVALGKPLPVGIMPARKRIITVSKRTAFWPCGSCRRNCTSGIQCDACTQWYHAQCEGLTEEELGSFSGSTAKYTCESCFSIEIGSAHYEYLSGLTRMRQVIIYN